MATIKIELTAGCRKREYPSCVLLTHKIQNSFALTHRSLQYSPLARMDNEFLWLPFGAPGLRAKQYELYCRLDCMFARRDKYLIPVNR